jgi:hypothetical protein
MLTKWRAVLAVLIGGVVFGFFANAQPRLKPPATYVQPTPPSDAEGATILSGLREVGLGGPYYLEFDLQIMPRRGKDRRMSGRWFGDRNATGPVTRVELWPEINQSDVWLVQSGPSPAVWHRNAEGAFDRVEGSIAVQPILDTQISPADLQTPFMYWTDFVYEGLARFRGRPTHVFLLYPPENQLDAYPGIGGARIYVDTQFGALSQVLWVDPGGSALKTITILDLKRVGEQWIVKTFEVRNDRTRDKTRFTVSAAALNTSLPGSLFLATGSATAAEFEIPADQLEQVR